MKTPSPIAPQISVCIRLLCVSVLLFLFPTVAAAANVVVDCNAGDSINSALASLDPAGPHTITVTGTCTETVNINLRNQIVIQAPVGQTATIQANNPNANVFNISGSRQITLNRLIVRGGRNGVSMNQGSVVNIHNSTVAENSSVGILFTQSTLTIDSSTIRDNALTGLAAQAASLANVGGASASQHVHITGNGTGVTVLEGFVQFNGNFTVEDNTNFAFDVAGGRLNLAGMQAGVENVIRSNGGAIQLRNAATGLIFGRNVIQNNNSNGIIVTNGSNLTMNETVLPDATVLTTTIEGHTTAGLTLAQQSQATIAGRHKIRNNGASAETCISTVCGGIRVFSGSQLTLRGGTEVTNNTGPGVNVEHNSALLIIIPVVITGNSQEGIRQLLHATTSIVPTTPTPAIGTNDISSVVCDDSSLIGGDLQGITKVTCKVAKPLKQ
jgi:Right handed beta helix region